MAMGKLKDSPPSCVGGWWRVNQRSSSPPMPMPGNGVNKQVASPHTLNPSHLGELSLSFLFSLREKPNLLLLAFLQ